MTQDVVRRRYKEEEIRQGELLQIVLALHSPVVAAAKSRVETALGFVKSLNRAQVDGAEDKVIAWTGGGEAGVVHSRHGGGSNASKAAAGVHGEIR